MGIERLLIRLDELGVKIPNDELLDLYVIALGDTAKDYCFKLVNDMRSENIKVDIDHMNRGLKPQMKYANKIGCKYTAVFGDNEISCGRVNLKNMATGEQTEVDLDKILEFIKRS